MRFPSSTAISVVEGEDARPRAIVARGPGQVRTVPVRTPLRAYLRARACGTNCSRTALASWSGGSKPWSSRKLL